MGCCSIFSPFTLLNLSGKFSIWRSFILHRMTWTPLLVSCWATWRNAISLQLHHHYVFGGIFIPFLTQCFYTWCEKHFRRLSTVLNSVRKHQLFHRVTIKEKRIHFNQFDPFKQWILNWNVLLFIYYKEKKTYNIHFPYFG